MSNKDNKRVPLSKDAVLLLRGVIVGKVLTLLVVGGLLWWLRPHLWVYSGPSSTSGQDSAGKVAAGPTFRTVSDVPSGSFNYGGSPAWAPIRQLVDSQIQSARPELQLSYIDPVNGSPSSSSGLRMLLNGQVDFAQSSRPVQGNEYAAAQEQGFTLEQRPVGIDGIAAVVNPSLQVRGLTVQQLQQIYLGQLNNWRQVGGPDLAITPFSQHSDNGDTIILFPQKQNQPLSSRVQFVYSTTEALRKVSRTPGGLYYGSASAVVSQCSVKPLLVGHTPNQLIPPYRQPLVSPNQCPRQRNQPNLEAFKNDSYPITHQLFVIIKQNQGREQQAGEAYANLLQTSEGQKAIQRAGFAQMGSNNGP